MSGYAPASAGETQLTTGSDNLSLGSSNNPMFVQPDRYSRTAFGQFRVAQPYTLADFTNKYEINTLLYETSSVGNGNVTHDSTQSTIFLSASGDSGDETVIRTEYYRYQAGKGMNIILTGYSQDAGNDNQMKRWGFVDSEDGLYFMLSGSTLGVARRTSVTGTVSDVFVPQSSWNVDKLDGTGISGLNLDVTKGNIYEIRFQWLGVGIVDFYINENHVHQMSHPNTIDGPYMKTAVLPVQWEIINEGATTASQLAFICGTVITEGGTDPPGLVHVSRNTASLAVSTSEKALLAIRPTILYPSGSGITNRAFVHPMKAVITTIGARANFNIILNPTIDGVFLEVDSNSHVEECPNINSFSGGEVVYSGFLALANESIEIDLKDIFGIGKRSLKLSPFANSQDVLIITGEKLTGGSTDMRAAFIFEEHI